ncbi:MAG: hypothetical protein C5B57_13450 [Blastocatellia bacterium]|nr:MAG: hypothetical protein C5B57_13450 [Blastocatellia bacterium]
MEISDVRKRVRETLDRAKRTASERRTKTDEAARDYQAFLDTIAIPVFRQITNVLRAEGHQFSVFTPGGGVRLASDRSGDDFIELTLDTTGSEPNVIGHSKHSRGRRVNESETPLGSGGPVRDLTEEDVLAFVLRELAALVER